MSGRAGRRRRRAPVRPGRDRRRRAPAAHHHTRRHPGRGHRPDHGNAPCASESLQHPGRTRRSPRRYRSDRGDEPPLRSQRLRGPPRTGRPDPAGETGSGGGRRGHDRLLRHRGTDDRSVPLCVRCGAMLRRGEGLSTVVPIAPGCAGRSCRPLPSGRDRSGRPRAHCGGQSATARTPGVASHGSRHVRHTRLKLVKLRSFTRGVRKAE